MNPKGKLILGLYTKILIRALFVIVTNVQQMGNLSKKLVKKLKY